MKELSREKRQEVVHYYILGYSYEEIVGKTGVSHGTVSNIIREVDNGQLAIPGSTFDQVNDLRQLSQMLGLVKRTGKRQPAIYDFLEQRVVYRLTYKGKIEERGWEDPIKAAHPEARG